MSRWAAYLVGLVVRGWLWIGLALACVAALELAAGVALWALDRPRTRELGGQIVYPQGAGIPLGWRPYLYWRKRPHEDPYRKVDDRGLRRTWEAAETARPEGSATRIFMFGSSSLWGSGVRDDFTIPSLVAQALSDGDSGPVSVTNFGEENFIGSQNLIALVLELQRGNIPDAAVFYEGGTDTAQAFLSGSVDRPRGESWRELITRNRQTALGVSFIRSSRVVRLVRRLAGREDPIPSDGQRPGSEAELGPLADELARLYAGNAALADTLADGFGFPVIHYWEPVLLRKRSPTAEETRLAQSHAAEYPLFAPFYREVLRALAARPELSGRVRFEDLGAVLDGHDQTSFFDVALTTEAANAIVARRIAADLRAVLEQRRNREPRGAEPPWPSQSLTIRWVPRPPSS